MGIFMKRLRSKNWSEIDENYLKEVYPTGDIATIASHFNKSRRNIISKANSLGVKRKDSWIKSWDEESRKFLIDNYFEKGPKYIADILKRKICNVCSMARRYNLYTKINRSHFLRKNHPTWQGIGEISKTYFGKVKANALARNLEFNITHQEMSDLFERQKHFCALSGIYLEFKSRNTIYNGNASLDRIDSSKDYTKNNCQWIDKDINIMKWDYSDEYFIDLCNKITIFNKSGGFFSENDIVITKKHTNFAGVGNLHSTVLGKIKLEAAARNHEFNISIDYLWDLFIRQKGQCKLSGIELCFSKTANSYKDRTASLDRIDSSKGYIEGNVQWIHKYINLMKNDLNQGSFLYLCEMVSDYQSFKNENLYNR